MGVIEFELTRTVAARIDAVFARLADIEGYNEWMPGKGSMLRRTTQTSPGAPAVGTTFLDDTSFGPTPGEIAEFQPPHTLVYHWWDKTKAGKLKLEGWPAYRLEDAGDETTLVHHHAEVRTYGMYRLATPFLRRIAMKERSATLVALAASFEPRGPAVG
ncbi:SRPBCC family protein [Microbacterium sp. QXD-8]|uniref:SRPBCC family protein n=1 Tax=Microbacterium psychrotolerans TaxID=3068321 RepID=A0ABU0Z1L5_9MICO|nr:SRPBCC family protein [Microbacterium sp. QXD-8]MDQ7878467.1 SRPBCC family protein [Microbacterium sp. QXD-8]